MPIIRYLAEISLGFWYVYISEIERKGRESERKD